MAKKASRRKVEIGSVVAIPLPGGKYAFARVLKDETFGVYSHVSDRIEPLEEIVGQDYAFFQSATDSEVRNGNWPVLGVVPFPDEELAWPPPRAAGVLPQFGLGMASPQISHKGRLRPAKLEDVIGLDIASFSHTPELLIDALVNRLIKGDHSKYRVQP